MGHSSGHEKFNFENIGKCIKVTYHGKFPEAKLENINFPLWVDVDISM